MGLRTSVKSALCERQQRACLHAPCCAAGCDTSSDAPTVFRAAIAGFTCRPIKLQKASTTLWTTGLQQRVQSVGHGQQAPARLTLRQHLLHSLQHSSERRTLQQPGHSQQQLRYRSFRKYYGPFTLSISRTGSPSPPVSQRQSVCRLVQSTLSHKIPIWRIQASAVAQCGADQ